MAAASDDRPIVLCGFMGVGKSGIGRILAHVLEREFLDSDAEVVARLGRSIPELFASGEEALFRKTEAEAVAELIARRPPTVIALGGGALEDQSTRTLVRGQSLLVHIYQPWDELRPALAQLARTRPLLSSLSEERVHELYLARQERYEQAELTVTTVRHGVPQAARAVLAAIASAHGGQKPDPASC